ncbi:MAG: HAD hydrolase family protein [Opitutales bacterium]|nr:HAD hydrolase family protein [Opitutales bacterium]
MSLPMIVSHHRWQQIRVLAMDVDGILTDGTIQVGENLGERKTFSVLDGLGMAMIREAGIPTAWVSGRHSSATIQRAGELVISHVLQDRKDKKEALQELARQEGWKPEEICYLGDDIIDIPALEWVGIGVSVPNALPEVKLHADWITDRPGGAGAVRDVCNRILANRRQK